MPITKLTPENNYPYMQERLNALGQAVPEAIADGKINWDTLRETLGNSLEDEGREEYFGLNWPGKREARKRASTPSRATLVPAPGEGVNEDETENLFIEGDNLEVLKLLQKSYAGKIKMIYIDPPYNTGNDFIYNDNFTDPLEAYLAYTGASGESGELLTTNTRADGRFHSKWLNMIYPRLILARQLLCEDGVIFVSIDNNEVQNLHQIMNEIFGEENIIQLMVWKKRYNAAKEKLIASIHEYVFVYTKNLFLLDPFYIPRSDEQIENQFNLKDEFFESRGPYMTQPLEAGNSMGNRNNLIYPIIAPDGSKILPRRQWIWSKERAYEALRDNRFEFKKNKDGNWNVRWKYYLLDDQGNIKGKKPFSIIEGIYNQEGTKEITELFGNGNIFPFPKPTALLSHLMDIAGLEKKDIVLDFFSGSCSTAHAMLLQDYKNSRKNQFIMVQLPEATPKDSVAFENGFNTISDIGKERIRRVIKKINKGNIQKAVAATPLLQNDQPQLDLGFKVFKYSRSNYKQWKPLHEENPEALTPLFDNLSEPLIQDWKKEGLLSEILLLEGFPLTSKLTYLEDLLQNQVYCLSAPDFCAHDLFVCLDETIQAITINKLTMEKEDIFICLDSALSDELKARVQDKFNVHVI
jgi:adenine-specific DNA-methyltransferase